MPTKTKVIINIMDDTPIQMALGTVGWYVLNHTLGQVPVHDIECQFGIQTLHLDHIPSAKIERFDVWRFTGDNG